MLIAGSVNSLLRKNPIYFPRCHEYRPVCPFLSQGHIQHHHQRKAQRRADRTDVAVFSRLRLGNKLLYHHIEHGACGEGQQIRKDRRDKRGEPYREQCPNGLYGAGVPAAVKMEVAINGIILSNKPLDRQNCIYYSNSTNCTETSNSC